MSTNSATWLVNGPENATRQLLLAHGAGAGMDHSFMTTVAEQLSSQGIRVTRFEFPYMVKSRGDGKRRPPDRMPVLQEAFKQQLATLHQQLPVGSKLFIGGKSMGGRVASLIAADNPGIAAGVICLGFPFHPTGKPDNYRADHLATIETPTLILQGERDSFGNYQEIAGYTLSPYVRCQFISDGDHSFKPRKLSGLTLEQNLAKLNQQMDLFINQPNGQ